MPLKKDYTKYTVEDFVCDDGFTEWVKTGKNDTEWQQWLLQNTQKAETIKEARTLTSLLGGTIDTEISQAKHDVWDKLNTEIADDKVLGGTSLKSWFYRLSVAASFAVLIWVAYQSQQFTHYDALNSAQNIVMSDNSEILLNEGSRLTYKANSYDKNGRDVTLIGEAFFEVAKGKPFVVSTDFGIVEVLGTSFNVNATNETLVVHCYTGKVRVTYASGEQATLLPGQGVQLNNTTNDVETLDFDTEQKSPTWTLNKVYENRALIYILKDLETFYDVKIELKPELEPIKVSASLKLTNLEETLGTITWPLNLKYEITGKRVRIFTIDEK